MGQGRRDQLAGIKADFVELDLGAFFGWDVVPQHIDGLVVFALFEQHTHHRQFAGFALVHKVGHHGHGFAFDFFFAGAVEVELEQVKHFAIDFGRAAWGNVDLDGVAVVEHAQRAGFVADFQAVFGFFKRPHDVQRRLLFAIGTGGELFAPAFGAHFALVTPMGGTAMTAFAVFVIALAWGTVGQNSDFFARSDQGILRRAHGVEAAGPIGHLQGLVERADGFGVFGAVGQQTHSAQAELALRAQTGFQTFVNALDITQQHAVGKSGLDCFEFARLGAEILDLGLGFLQFFAGFGQLFLGFVQTLHHFCQLMGDVLFARKIHVAKRTGGHQQQAQHDFKE